MPEPTAEPEENARMTTEQLHELADALTILCSKSSVLKERDELRALMEENLKASAAAESPSDESRSQPQPTTSSDPSIHLTKRLQTMLSKIDQQLSEYDARVGTSLHTINTDAQGRISVKDLERALGVIKHRPDEEVGARVVRLLDVDKDGFVELEHVFGLIGREEGLGIVLDDEAQSILGQGNEIKAKGLKPRKEDIIVQE